MVQPFHPSVDSAGETAVLCIDGEPAHVLRKGAVLRPDEVAPIRDDALGAAEVMYDPELVVPGAATEDELELAREIVAEVERRFDYLPLYARVDMIRDADGAPLLLELEAIEPNFYLEPGAVDGAGDRRRDRRSGRRLNAAGDSRRVRRDRCLDRARHRPAGAG